MLLMAGQTAVPNWLKCFEGGGGQANNNKKKNFSNLFFTKFDCFFFKNLIFSSKFKISVSKISRATLGTSALRSLLPEIVKDTSTNLISRYLLFSYYTG